MSESVFCVIRLRFRATVERHKGKLKACMYRGKLFFQSKNTFKTLSISKKALIQTEGWRLQIDSLRKQRQNMSENHINCFCLCDTESIAHNQCFEQNTSLFQTDKEA